MGFVGGVLAGRVPMIDFLLKRFHESTAILSFYPSATTGCFSLRIAHFYMGN